MSRLPRPCLVCGRPSSTTVCPLCAPARGRSTAERGYGAPWQRLRLEILGRDGWTCRWCGGPADTVDHVIPLALGGPRLDPSNLVAACRSCNSARGAGLA